MELEKGNGINFVPCLTWVRRGVAKPDPEHVKLTSEELSSFYCLIHFYKRISYCAKPEAPQRWRG